MLKTFILLILFKVTSTFLFAAETEVFVIPGGQGNFSIIKYQNQAIIVDAGSSEMAFPAIYSEKATQSTREYQLRPAVPPVESSAATITATALVPSAAHHATGDIAVRSYLDHLLDSDETSSNLSSDSQGSTPPTKKIKPETKKKKVKDTYEGNMLELSRDHLPKDGYVLHVKTIVVSHGDKDHYNFIPKLFDDENPVIIETLILGGFAEDYDESFRNWVRHQADDQLSVHPLNIIYTGTSTGEESSALGIWPAAGYARAYCSKLVDKTQTEQRIEGALRFEQEGDSAPPTVEILSMNAGHAMEEVTQGTERRKIVRRANYDKNANSIVLRVKTQTQSMIFSGDADNSTWDHILTNYLFEQEALRTDYLLISHHGSREEGATRADILDVLQPKACVVSVGRHLGYHHPHQESLELLLKSDSSLYVIDDYHAVSYFGYVPSSNPKKFIHKVKKMKRAIFSTLNSGIISIPFGEGFGIRVSQAKETIYTDSANAESKFSIDYGSVMSPEEGESIVDLIQRFIRSKSERQKSVSIWEITDKRRNTISHPAASGGSGFNPDEETTHYDLLPDRENNRLYILETIE